MIKSDIRKSFKEFRNKMSAEDVSRLSFSAAKRFISSDIYKNAKTIMLYWPLGNETDTRTILEQIFKDGKTAVLPVTNPNTDDIIPVIMHENAEMKTGAYRITEPKNAPTVNKEDIDVIIVPGIAFDLTGARIGFGKGCYDRFLKDTKAKKVGYCYACQITDKIMSDEFDICMDYLITDKELVFCE